MAQGTLRQPQDVVWADTNEKLDPEDPRALNYRQLSAAGGIDTTQPLGSLRNPSVLRTPGDELSLDPGSAYLDIRGQLQFAPVSTADIEAEEFGAAPADPAVKPRKPLLNAFQFYLNPSERSRVEAITRMYPEREFSRDPSGNLVVRVSPTSPWYYLNKPGVSLQDVSDVVTTVALFSPAGRAANAGQPLASNALRVGTASAGISAVQDIATGQPIDPAKAAFAGGGGVVGEYVGAGLNSLLRSRPQPAARPMPGRPRNALAETADQVGDAFAADARGAAPPGQAGIPMTRGQRTGDYNQIAWEQAAARGARGQEAGEVMRGFMGQQARAVRETGLGLSGQSRHATPAAAAEAVRTGMAGRAAASRAAVDDAYQAIRESDAAINAPTVGTLPDRIRKGLEDEFFSPEVMASLNPRTARIFGEIERLATNAPRLAGKGGGKGAPDPTYSLPIAGVERMRQGLNAAYAAAQGNDRAALAVARREFDGWLNEAIDKSLIFGDPAAVAALKKARSLHADYRRTFGGGRRDDGAQKMMQRLIAENANETDAVNLLFGRAELSGAGDGVALVQAIKRASDGGAEFQALREGAVMRLMSRIDNHATGGVTNIGYRTIARDWRRALDGPAAPLMRELFTPAEIAEMRGFVSQVERLSPPEGTVNRSGSGYEVSRAFGSLMGRLKILAPVAKSMDDASNVARARTAIDPGGVGPGRLPIAGPAGGGLGALHGGAPADLTGRYRPN